MSFRRTTALLVFGLVLSPSWVARAADSNKMAEARRLYTQAKDAFKDHKYADAARGFEAASHLHPAAVALYIAGQAWEFAHNAARAADDYARSLEIPRLSASQAARAKERLDALEKQVGTVVVTGKSSTQAQLDDGITLSLPARLHGAAGNHTLSLTDASGLTSKRTLSLAAGKTMTVDAQPAAKAAQPEAPAPGTPASAPQSSKPTPSSPPPPTASKPRHSSFLETVGFITTGIGVGGLVGGMMLGLSANDSASTYKTTPSQATYDHAEGLQTKTNIMLIAGGVLTAAGVGLVIWQSTKHHDENSASLEVRALPSAIWAQGRF
jgi:hypothetical protein